MWQGTHAHCHCERSVGARRHRCRCVLVRVCYCEMTNKPEVKASLARKGNPPYYGVPTFIDRASYQQQCAFAPAQALLLVNIQKSRKWLLFSYYGKILDKKLKIKYNKISGVRMFFKGGCFFKLIPTILFVGLIVFIILKCWR